MSVAPERVGEGVFAIDTQLQRPRLAASHLVIDAGRGAFIDVGTTLSVPQLLAALGSAGLAPADVEYVFLTHVHLDHAGGAGELLRHLPRATLVLHPRAAPHMIDPQRLVAAAEAVYGAAHFRAHYGVVRPVEAARVRSVAAGERIALGARSFEFLHTPGHALHHVALFDAASRAVFTGDTFGLSYREFDTARGAFVFATTSPTQFDPAQLHDSVDRLLALAPEVAYLTHYSRVGDLAKLGADLHDDIEACVRIAMDCATAPDPAALIRPRLHAHLAARLDAHGCPLDAAQRQALLDGDVILNADGLVAWLARRKPH